MKKLLLIIILVLAPAGVFAAPPKAPILGTPKILSATAIRWPFVHTDKTAVAFELWDVLSRRLVTRVDNSTATFIDETNVVPADPDMACGRYIVAVNRAGEQSFGQPFTYPCVRTPPVTPPQPVVEVINGNSIRITLSQGDNDPATGVGMYEAERDAWVSPEHLFVANPTYPTLGEWNAHDGVLLIGLRANTSYTFYIQARSVTGETSRFGPAVRIRMPAEQVQLGAPKLDRLGPLVNLRNVSLLQTFKTKIKRPVIAGLVSAGALVTVDIDDRPYSAVVAPPVGALASFAFTPPVLAPGLHTIRLGAVKDGATAWTPTIELRILSK